MRRHRRDALFLTQVYIGFKFYPSRKLLVSEFLLSISQTFHCSMSALEVKIVPLQDVHQLLMLFVGTFMYSEPETFTLIVFIICYNCYYYFHYFIVCLFFVYVSVLICIVSGACL
jgi:hypothetical protein